MEYEQKLEKTGEYLSLEKKRNLKLSNIDSTKFGFYDSYFEQDEPPIYYEELRKKLEVTF